MLYTWSAIYHSQLGRGDDYTLLEPVVSVWIVTGVLFADTPLCHLRFRIGDPEAGLSFSEHFALHLLQLPKWRMRKDRISEKDRWVYFFKEGKNIDVDDPPDILKNSKEMRDAMDVFKRLFGKPQKLSALPKPPGGGNGSQYHFSRRLKKPLSKGKRPKGKGKRPRRKGKRKGKGPQGK